MARNDLFIKAGSSVFQDYNSFSRVADLILPHVNSDGVLYFVVSAVKGETDRTIERIASKVAMEQGGEFDVFHQELQSALRGENRPYSGVFNTSEIAAELVQPEMSSVRNLVRALEENGVSAVGMEHGQRYPLIGKDNGEFLYATPDVGKSRNSPPQYNASVIVVPGFGVRNTQGKVMCTGRGASDLTLVQLAEVYDGNEIIYWKDTGGFWKNSDGPEEGILSDMTKKEAVARSDEGVLDKRVYELFKGRGIRITMPGSITDGTYIDLRPSLMDTLEITLQ